MTTALVELDPTETIPISVSQAQSYWSASLSVSHRQATYLQQCLVHLDEFLRQTGFQLSPSAGTSVTFDTPSYPTNNSDDTVRELERDLDGEIDIVGLAEHL